MTCFGFGMMIIVILFSSPLAALVMPDEGDSVKTMQMVLILIFLCPVFRSAAFSIRGFYQGLKHMEIYALSQVLEQVARGISAERQCDCGICIAYGSGMGAVFWCDFHQYIGNSGDHASEAV